MNAQWFSAVTASYLECLIYYPHRSVTVLIPVPIHILPQINLKSVTNCQCAAIHFVSVYFHTWNFCSVTQFRNIFRKRTLHLILTVPYCSVECIDFVWCILDIKWLLSDCDNVGDNFFSSSWHVTTPRGVNVSGHATRFYGWFCINVINDIKVASYKALSQDWR